MNKLKDTGLDQTDSNSIIDILRKNKKVMKIILFGSRAKENYRNGSDVGIALLGSDLKLNDVLNASIEIDKLCLPYKFDLVIYHRIK